MAAAGPPAEIAAEHTAIEANIAIHMRVREGELSIKASLSELLYESNICCRLKRSAGQGGVGSKNKGSHGGTACSQSQGQALLAFCAGLVLLW
jgi:hypothetical protein